MFEHSLIGLEARKKSRRGWFSLPVAILIHVVAFASFTFASYWDIEEVPEPPLNVVFIGDPPPPPPPQRGSGQPEKPTAVKPPEIKPPAPQQTVQPRDVPNELPPVASQVVTNVGVDLPPGGHPDGVDEGGVPDGVVDGVPFSTGTDPSILSTGIVGSPAPQPANDKPIVVGGAVKRPVPVYHPQPRYTETARRARVQGVVVLDAVIDEHGNVIDLEVRKGQPMGLDQAALDAVRTWRFKPATLHGQPVKVYFTLTVNFKLQ